MGMPVAALASVALALTSAVLLTATLSVLRVRLEGMLLTIALNTLSRAGWCIKAASPSSTNGMATSVLVVCPGNPLNV